VKPPELILPPIKARRPFAWLLPLAAVLVVSAALVALLLPALSNAKRGSQRRGTYGDSSPIISMINSLSGDDGGQALSVASQPRQPAWPPRPLPKIMPPGGPAPPAPVSILLPTAYNEPSVSGAVQADSGSGNAGVYALNRAGNLEASRLGINSQTGVATFDTRRLAGIGRLTPLAVVLVAAAVLVDSLGMRENPV